MEIPPSLTSSPGLLLTSSGYLTTSGSLFYSPTLQTPTINGGTFTNFSYVKSISSKYAGIGSFNNAFIFAGAKNESGSESGFILIMMDL